MAYELQITVPGDWWYFAAIIGVEAPPRILFTVDDRPVAFGVHLTTAIGGVMITGTEGQTTIMAIPATPEDQPQWRALLAKVERIATAARSLRRDAVGTTIDEIIKEYERVKAAGEPVTLKQLAEQAGIRYSYVRKRKSIKAARAGNKKGNMSGDQNR